MENRTVSKFGFINQVFIIFSVAIIFLTLVGELVGDSAKRTSTMFNLGNQGLSFSIIMQFLIVAILITSVKEVIYSERFFKNMMALWRTIIMLFSNIVINICFIIAFGWFPVNSVAGWIGFFGSFAISFVVSTLVMVIKTKRESKKYEELFKKYKSAQQGHESIELENESVEQEGDNDNEIR